MHKNSAYRSNRRFIIFYNIIYMAYVSVWISNKVLNRFIFISDSLTVQYSPTSFKFASKINFNLFIEDFIKSCIKLLYDANTRPCDLSESNKRYLTINIYLYINIYSYSISYSYSYSRALQCVTRNVIVTLH